MPANTKYKPEYAIQIYHMLRCGYTQQQIAETLDITKRILIRWYKQEPHVQAAVQYHKEQQQTEKEPDTLAHYVYERLSPQAQEVWDELLLLYTEEEGGGANPYHGVEALLQGKGKRMRQHLFVHATVHHNFNLSTAMRMCNVTRDQYAGWCQDPAFTKMLDEILFHKKNFFEDHLVKLVRSGDTAATLFANRTLNSDRYVEPTKQVAVSGEINLYNHTVPIDQLNLPIEVLRPLLDALQQHEASTLAQQVVPVLEHQPS